MYAFHFLAYYEDKKCAWDGDSQEEKKTVLSRDTQKNIVMLIYVIPVISIIIAYVFMNLCCSERANMHTHITHTVEIAPISLFDRSSAHKLYRNTYSFGLVL